MKPGPIRRRFGQHFLEPAWADKVVAAMAPGPGDFFLEIGPGTGALTLRLAARVARVTAVEIDRDLVAALTARAPGNVTVIPGDFLEIDAAPLLTLRVGPEAGTRRVRVAGNLPYNASSPILFRLLDLARHNPIADATLMLQREVADRLAAAPGTSDYGVLSVLVQWRTGVERLLTLPPGAFRPAPKVRSALVRLTFRPPPLAVADEALLERLVRRIFTQRRKMLVNALGPFARERSVSPEGVLADAGIDPRRRPETLQLVEIARLADAFSASSA